MMEEASSVKVLAIASHVTSGYVGNTMATFCMQTLGCEVSAIHTVNYSNHVAYKRFKGRKSTPEEVAELYAGLKEAGLDKFDIMLSGYAPSAGIVEEVGKIARQAKLRANTRPGSFFWILDPVMGDNGRLYVPEDNVPVYKSLLKDADLILPNQTEAEILSDIKIKDLESMYTAIAKFHKEFNLPHVLITSIRIPQIASAGPTDSTAGTLSVIGSTATSESKPRLFRITVPEFPVFFSGTGDMFAALLVARLRQAAQEAGVLDIASWQSPDDVAAADLPLAKATEKVLASMNAVLEDTAAHYDREAALVTKEGERRLNDGVGKEAVEAGEIQRHLRLTRAAEVRVVQNSKALRDPPHLDRFKAQAIAIDAASAAD